MGHIRPIKLFGPSRASGANRAHKSFVVGPIKHTAYGSGGGAHKRRKHKSKTKLNDKLNAHVELEIVQNGTAK